MSEQSQFPRRPATLFNDFKFDMPKSLKPVDGAKFPATWTWEISLSGTPSFKVNDGIYGKDDKNARNKEVPLSAIKRNELLYVLKESINNPLFTSAQVVILDTLWNNSTGKFNTELSTLATFTIKKTADGEILVHFVRGTYEVTFSFTDPKLQIKTKDANGNIAIDKGLASRAYVDSFVLFSSKFLDNEEWARYTREAKGGKGGNGGGGQGNGGNNHQGGGGGNQSSNTQDFEDFDF